MALKAKLLAGDRVLFRGGVAYRGQINADFSGTTAAPVRYVGDAWGAPKAIMHGGDALPAGKPCTSALACGGALQWRNIVTMPVPAGSDFTDWITGSGSLMQLSQFPMPKTAIDLDDIGQMTAIPKANTLDLKKGVLKFTGTPPGPSAQLVIWSKPNVVKYTDTLTVAGTTLQFTIAKSFDPYTDRDMRYAVVNDVKRIQNPGQFAVADGVAYVWPNAAGPLSIGARRQGFEVHAANVSIEGFRFTGFSAKEEVRSGVAIGAFRNSVANLNITRNDFVNIAMQNGMGVIHLTSAQSATITHNSFSSIVWGSGIRATNVSGKVVARCNVFRDTGRTALYFYHDWSADVRDNIFENINGVHANGLTLYGDDRLSVVDNNLFLNTDRPVTLSGTEGKPYFADKTPASMLLSNNLIDARGSKVTAVTSWGGDLYNVVMRDNTVLGGGTIYRFNAADRNISLANNKRAADTDIAVKRAAIAKACSI